MAGWSCGGGLCEYKSVRGGGRVTWGVGKATQKGGRRRRVHGRSLDWSRWGPGLDVALGRTRGWSGGIPTGGGEIKWRGGEGTGEWGGVLSEGGAC